MNKILILIVILADWAILSNVKSKVYEVDPGLPLFSLNELEKYNGVDSNTPIYLALDGYVYDVSSSREKFYGPNAPYHELVGKDSSILLHVVGANIIKQKYNIVGIYTK